MPVAGSEHHAIYWRRRPPKGTARRPAILQLARARIEQALLDRRGPLWQTLASVAPVFHRAEDGAVRAGERRRRLRRDAAVNLASLLNVILSCTDLASGLVIAVNQPGARRQSKSWADLAGFAYGDLIHGEVSPRRVQRHARTLQTLGFIRTVQWYVYDTPTGTIRSRASKKFVTAKLWDLLGLTHAVKALRRSREHERNKDRLQRVSGLQADQRRRQQTHQDEVAAAAPQRPNAAAYVAKPTPPRRPPDGGTERAAREAIADIVKKLYG